MAFQEAEETIQQLLAKVQSDPKLKADAARGIIRGPQLALVELELRRLTHSRADTRGTSQEHPGQPLGGDKREGAGAERQSGTTAGNAEGGNGHDMREQERQGAKDAKQQEDTGALAEAVLAYYQQLGHMLSCAVDVR